MRPGTLLLTAIATCSCTPASAQAQGSASTRYENSAQGLRQQIKDLAEAYNAADAQGRRALLQSVAIPDASSWFHGTFGENYGAVLAREYARQEAKRAEGLSDAFSVVGAKPGVKVEAFDDRCREDIDPQNYPILAMRAARADTFYQVRLTHKNWTSTLWFFVYADGRFRYTGGFDYAHKPFRDALFEAFRVTTGARPATGGDLQPAVLAHQEAPQYPKQASKRLVEGRIILWVLIRKDGTVGDVLPSTGSCWFARAAAESVRRWRFQPARLNGQPVETVTGIELNFGFRARSF